MSDGGKGSKQRPTNQNKYGQGYDLIFKKKHLESICLGCMGYGMVGNGLDDGQTCPICNGTGIDTIPDND
jgi:Asp/Glu/hydantoin racemase